MYNQSADVKANVVIVWECTNDVPDVAERNNLVELEVTLLK